MNFVLNLLKTASFRVLTILIILFSLLSCNNEELFVEYQEVVNEEKDETEENDDSQEDAPEINYPIVSNDIIIINQDSSVLLNLLENDEYIPLKYRLTYESPLNGVLIADDKSTEVLSDDELRYIPNLGFFGEDTFTYTVCDSLDEEICTTGSVVIKVNEKEEVVVNEDEVGGELKAFPSAFGAGANVTGGRGGEVYHVNNLNDNGPGSFRDAVSVSNRTIVFDVSGIIVLRSRITNVGNNLTIAGQTAPQGGITIDGDRVYFDNVDNVIVRYIRFRGGIDSSPANDSFSAANDITNQIFDHCSFSFGGDEAASWYGTGDADKQDKITIQRCLFSESKTGTIVGGQSGVGTVTGDISVLNNLWYNINHRYPNVAGDGANIEIINNVVWTVVNRLTRGNGSFNLNHIGNYYDYGRRPIQDTRLNMFSWKSGVVPKIYSFDNKIKAVNVGSTLSNSVLEMNANNNLTWKFFLDAGGFDKGEQLPSNYFSSNQFSLLGKPLAVKSSEEAFIDVRSNVGCNKRLNEDGSVSENSDALDIEWLNNVKSGNYVEQLPTSLYIVPQLTSISRQSDYDTDKDGMPDLWEVAKFGDLSNDGAQDFDGDGYTNLEEFINLVDL